MNRFSFGLLWLGLIGTSIAADPPIPARNLVNWGTLDGVLQDSGLPAGWSTYPPGYDRYDCFAVTGMAHQGTRCLRLSSQAPWASVITGQHRVEPGTRQAGQAWVRLPAEATGEAVLRIDYLSDAGVTLGSSPVAVVRRAGDDSKEDWVLLKVESRAETFPKATRFQMIAAVRGGGTVFWDDFELFSTTDLGN